MLRNTAAAETLGDPCDEPLLLSFAILCRDFGVHQAKEAFKRGTVSVCAAPIGSLCVLTTCCDFVLCHSVELKLLVDGIVALKLFIFFQALINNFHTFLNFGKLVINAECRIHL